MEDKKQRYVVIQSLTKGKIAAVGSSRWFFKNKKILLLWGIIGFGVFFIGSYLSKPNVIIGWISSIPIIAEYIYVFAKVNVEENKFWNKVKDLPEPKDLREIK